MSEIIQIQDRRQKARQDYPIIKKIVDGKVINCVNIDALTPAQYSRYLSQFSDET